MKVGRMGAFAVAIALAAGSAVADEAQDSGAARADAEAAFHRAEDAGRALRFADALAGYREALARDPSAPFAVVSRARAAELAAHAEGDFAPFTELEAMRRSPARLADPNEIARLSRDAAAFPSGRVRAEAWLTAGESWRRLHDLRAAETELRRAATDPAADPLTQSLALSDLVAVLRERGELSSALREIDAHPGVLPSLRAEIARLVRRAELRRVAFGVLGLVGLAALAAIARLAWRARDVRLLPSAVVRPLPVAAALYLGGAGAVVASIRGDGDPRPFLLLGAGVAIVAVAARALALGGSPRPIARAAHALACAAAVVAVAFLAIEQTADGYLSSFGL